MSRRTICLLLIAVIVGADIWPGMLEEFLCGFAFVCLIIPAIVSFAAVWIYFGRRSLQHTSRIDGSNRPRLVFWGLVLIGVGLLWTHTPQRIAFLSCRGRFEELADQAKSSESGTNGQPQWIGPYRIDSLRSDDRGGTFLRTYLTTEGLGPDQISTGFAKAPHGLGSPFGNARYRQRHLFAEWYVFSASDDY